MLLKQTHTGMNELDGDGHRLSSRGRQAERDIVQFVPFSKYSGPQAAAMLAKVSF